MANSMIKTEPEWANRPEPPFFRKIFVLHYGKDFSLLKEFTDEIVFVTNGYEATEDLTQIIIEKVADFDPVQDAIVAVGKVNVSLITGIVISNLHPNSPIWIGVFTKSSKKDKKSAQYHWLQIQLEDLHAKFQS